MAHALGSPFDAVAVRPLRRLGRRVRGRLGAPAVYYVVGEAQWAEYEIGRAVVDALRARGAPPAHLVADGGGLRGQVVHFGNRYSYLEGGAFRRVDPSNAVFLTWFHSFPPGLEDAAAARLHAALLEALPRIERVVVSCGASEDALRELGVPAAQLARIPIGVDAAAFTPPSPAQRAAARAALGVPADAACVGSFQKDGVGWGDGAEPKLIKGPDTLLAAIERLAAERDDLFVLLTGPSRGYVRRGLERLGVPYAHHLLDDYADVARCYHALDAYLVTARSEGGPRALGESWASGVPVVSTRVGMPADLVEHGASGLLADVEDAAALARLTAEVLADDGLRARCVAGGLAAVGALDWPVVAARHADLYAPALAARAA